MGGKGNMKIGILLWPFFASFSVPYLSITTLYANYWASAAWFTVCQEELANLDEPSICCL